MGSILAEVDASSRLARIVIDRPERRNALDRAMWCRLAAVAVELAADPAVGAVVVEGAHGTFAAGADVGEFDEARVGEATHAYDELTEAALAALEAIDVPTIALVEGACLGGGLSIALACDVVLVTPTAQLGVPAARLGTLYPRGALQRLVRRVGEHRARYLLFSAVRVGAEEAVVLGLAERVVGSREEGLAIAAQLAQLSSVSHIATKLALADPGRHRALATTVFSQQDYAEGRQAFRERREPRFVEPGAARAELRTAESKVYEPTVGVEPSAGEECSRREHEADDQG
jgi:enoyl-CoA hydratase/carnithine racemase